ncbi:hypothetical protein PM082_012021 [Marasmius tenuissimus]|nr:hypothetical protein PM082_012021 [Marasmius tenuissimus]
MELEKFLVDHHHPYRLYPLPQSEVDKSRGAPIALENRPDDARRKKWHWVAYESGDRNHEIKVAPDYLFPDESSIDSRPTIRLRVFKP